MSIAFRFKTLVTQHVVCFEKYDHYSVILYKIVIVKCTQNNKNKCI